MADRRSTVVKVPDPEEVMSNAPIGVVEQLDLSNTTPLDRKISIVSADYAEGRVDLENDLENIVFSIQPAPQSASIAMD